MKLLNSLLFSGIIAALAGCSTTSNKTGGTATVEFVQPEKYTDIQLRNMSAESTSAQLLPDLERYIQKQAKLYLPEGEQLRLKITDIDDAGWIRPLGANPRRVVRSSQPARVDFEYEFVDKAGKVLDSGRETLSDLAWDRLDRSFDNESLPLVKRMLRDWISQQGRHHRQPKAAGG